MKTTHDEGTGETAGSRAWVGTATVLTAMLLAMSAAVAADDKAGRPGYAEMLKARHAAAGKAALPAQPYNPIKRLDDEGQVPEIEMFVGESRVFPAPGVARIAVGNGALLTAAALDNKEVILFANGPGTSSLFVWNADGRYQRVKINIVPGDTSRYAREIAAFLSSIPKAKASIVGANIIVEGDELSDADLAKIEELAKRYPQIVNFTNRVGWEQMVMLDVKVVEFPRTELTDMGLKWNGTGGAAIGAIWGPGRRGHDGPYEIDIRTGEDTKPPISGAGGGPAFIPRGLNVLSIINLGLNAQLNLLAQDGKAAILAEPQLSTRSGSKADFLAGGEIPYSVVTNNGVHILFKPYGIKLEITPRVDRNGVIRAAIKSEVSSIDRSITTAGGPALLSRQTNTEFNLRAGETIVLSGLLQRDTSTDADKLPFLGDIPVLGALFRSKRYQNKETELVVFVTPSLINAHSPGLVDRIDRTTERLEQTMGPTPYLSDPLQPGARYEKPDAVPPPPPPPPPVAAPVEQMFDAERAIYPAPVSALPVSTPVSTASVALARNDNPFQNGAKAQQYRVRLDKLPLRAAPNVNAGVVIDLAEGDVVEGSSAALRETWMPVRYRSGASRLRGWVATQWLEPVARQP